jgi:hypothetical protein
MATSGPATPVKFPGQEVLRADARRLDGSVNPCHGDVGEQRYSFMLFMVIETFRNHDGKAIYDRLRDKGRQMPEGLTFVSSWVSADLGRCFQIMETDDVTRLQRWISEWTDLMSFEVVPIVQSKQTAVALGAAV